jgi:hypothetical protein
MRDDFMNSPLRLCDGHFAKVGKPAHASVLAFA